MARVRRSRRGGSPTMSPKHATVGRAGKLGAPKSNTAALAGSKVNKAGAYAPALYLWPVPLRRKLRFASRTLRELREFDLSAPRPPTDSAYGAPLGLGRRPPFATRAGF